MISVIIPTVNQVDLVKQCAASFMETTSGIPSEVIVVDDGSPPDVQNLLTEWANDVRIRFIPKPVNEGFSRSVNRGMEEARGEFVLLANNDIIFHEAGWLNLMLEAMNASQKIGIVGARLLYPNRTIQHAGVFPARNLYFDHRYRGFPAEYPPALAVEEVHAVTGALMLIRKELLADIGLFSEQYFIAFEDVDFCYRAKQNGWKIVYCGKASAIHLEGQTRGTRLSNKNRFWRRKELEARSLFWSKWKGVSFTS
jgi:GT2 family glycosyltransferase